MIAVPDVPGIGAEVQQDRLQDAKRLWQHDYPYSKYSQTQNTKPDYVYFLLDAEDHMVKIGHSKNVLDRMKVLSKQSGRTLELLGVIEGGRTLKMRLQKRFKPLLIDEDEWFSAEPELMDYIRDNTHAL